MKKLSEIRQELAQLLRETENIRLDKMAAYKQGMIYVAIPIGLTVLFVFLGFGMNNPAWYVGALIAFIVIFVVYYYVAAKPLRAFKKEFKSSVIERFVQTMYPGVEYHAEGYIDPSDFSRSYLYRTNYTRYKGEDYLRGNIGGTHFQMSELNIVRKVRRRSSSSSGSRTTTSTTTIFKGFFVVLEFDQRTYSETYILPDVAEKLFGGLGKMIQKSLGSFFQKGKMVYLENFPEFEKQYAVYGTDEIETARIITPGLVEAIFELHKRWNVRPRISFMDNRAYIAIQTNRNLFKVNARKSLVDDQQELIEELYDELALCMSIVEEIKLDL